MKKIIPDLSRKRIVIVTHRSLMPVIPGDDLRRYFLEREIRLLLYITHPLLLLKESRELRSGYEYYIKGKIKQNYSAKKSRLPESLRMIMDCIFSLYWVSKTHEKFDIYFGINNLNAFIGILLKKMGYVKKVVYYTIDLYPQRFENIILNKIYHSIDRFCVKHCDETWNVSPYLVQYRSKRIKLKTNSNRQFTVPIGVWLNTLKITQWTNVKKKKIVYVGHLKNFYGVDLVIRSLPIIIKSIPEVHFDIVGGGEELESLRKMAKKLDVINYVTFHGWKEKHEAEKIIADAAIGVAPFNTNIIDEKIKNADPAKIKDYLSLGVPVILTNATLNSSAIETAKCGLVINFTPDAMAKAVITLLSNPTRLRLYRKNAIRFIEKFDWVTLFSENVNRIL